MKGNKPWWIPELTDDEWLSRIRSDYPEETEGMSDDYVRCKYSNGMKYTVDWDHIGDALEQFEKLSDSYFELLEALKEAKAELEEIAISEGGDPYNNLQINEAIANAEGKRNEKDNTASTR